MHDKDREDFIKRISWMFDETEKYNKLNQLALENGGKINEQKMLLSES